MKKDAQRDEGKPAKEKEKEKEVEGEGESIDEEEWDTRCGICMDTLDEPKTGFARCSHAYCAHCLCDYVKIGGDTCPLCRAQFKDDIKGEDDVKALPTHLYLQQLAIRHKQGEEERVISCCDCEEDAVATATLFCVQCDGGYCEKCSKRHLRTLKGKLHTLVAIDEYLLASETDKPTSNKETCPVHTEQTVDLYCKECQRVVCTQCIHTLHGNHKISTIANELPHLGKPLKNIVDGLQAELSMMNYKEERMRDNIGEIDRVYEEECAKVNKYYTDINVLVAQRRQENLDALQRERDERKKPLEAALSSLQNAHLTAIKGPLAVNTMLDRQQIIKALHIAPLMQHALDSGRQREVRCSATFFFKSTPFSHNLGDSSIAIRKSSTVVWDGDGSNQFTDVIDVCFIGNDSLLVGRRINGVQEYSLTGEKIRDIHAGELYKMAVDKCSDFIAIMYYRKPYLEMVHRYGKQPSYCIYPKKGASMYIGVVQDPHGCVVLRDQQAQQHYLSSNTQNHALLSQSYDDRSTHSCLEANVKAIKTANVPIIFVYNNEVVAFARHTKQIVSKGKGKGAAQVDGPLGIAIHRISGDILVADHDNKRLSVWDKDLKWKGILPLKDTPSSVSVSEDGTLLAISFWTRVMVMPYPSSFAQV